MLKAPDLAAADDIPAGGGWDVGATGRAPVVRFEAFGTGLFWRGLGLSVSLTGRDAGGTAAPHSRQNRTPSERSALHLGQEAMAASTGRDQFSLEIPIAKLSPFDLVAKSYSRPRTYSSTGPAAEILGAIDA
jgi:hypothetical protein